MLQQLDFFVLLGWIAMARCGIIVMRVGIFSTLLVCTLLFLIEAVFRIQFSIVIEAGMRLSLLPET